MKFTLGLITGIALSSLFFLWYTKTKLTIPNNNPTQLVESSQTTPNTSPADDDFADFYHQFHYDSLFQLRHIIFPLEGIPPRDSTGSIPDHFRWQKESWVIHRPFNDQDGNFVQEFTRVGSNMVVEQIQDTGGNFGMQRRFARIGDEWHLIYYAAMNQLAQE